MTNKIFELIEECKSKSFSVKPFDNNRIFLLNTELSFSLEFYAKKFIGKNRMECGFFYNNGKILFFGNFAQLQVLSEKKIRIMEEKDKIFVGYRKSSIKGYHTMDTFYPGFARDQCCTRHHNDLLTTIKELKPTDFYQEQLLHIDFTTDYSDDSDDSDDFDINIGYDIGELILDAFEFYKSFILSTKYSLIYSMDKLGKKNGFKFPKCLAKHLIEKYIHF